MHASYCLPVVWFISLTRWSSLFPYCSHRSKSVRPVVSCVFAHRYDYLYTEASGYEIGRFGFRALFGLYFGDWIMMAIRNMLLITWSLSLGWFTVFFFFFWGFWYGFRYLIFAIRNMLLFNLLVSLGFFSFFFFFFEVFDTDFAISFWFLKGK